MKRTPKTNAEYAEVGRKHLKSLGIDVDARWFTLGWKDDGKVSVLIPTLDDCPAPTFIAIFGRKNAEIVAKDQTKRWSLDGRTAVVIPLDDAHKHLNPET